MVAEKPSICNSIAAALAGSLDKCRTSGRSPPIHEFTGSFKGQIVTFRVTSVTGHVFSVDFPAAYQNWESTQPVELFGAPIVRKPTRGSMVKFLKDAGKNADSLVLWLDCDREGENICFEVIDCVKAVEDFFKNKQSGHISIVSSIAGYRGLPNSSGYGPSKAALTNFSESIYFDFKKYNVKVSVVSPGFIKTPLTNKNEFPMPFLRSPEFAAEKIYNG